MNAALFLVMPGLIEGFIGGLGAAHILHDGRVTGRG
jgi:hypothetical protein